MAPRGYVVIALLIVLLLVLLVREVKSDEVSGLVGEKEDIELWWDDKFLNLSERIFDSMDYRWLREEIGFPDLARSLARFRKKLALRWLRAFRRSLGETLLVPRHFRPGGGASHFFRRWRLLLLTLRLHIILGYATLVVYLFGPHHLTTLAFSWMRFIPESGSYKRRTGKIHLGHSR